MHDQAVSPRTRPSEVIDNHMRLHYLGVLLRQSLHTDTAATRRLLLDRLVLVSYRLYL